MYFWHLFVLAQSEWWDMLHYVIIPASSAITYRHTNTVFDAKYFEQTCIHIHLQQLSSEFTINRIVLYRQNFQDQPIRCSQWLLDWVVFYNVVPNAKWQAIVYMVHTYELLCSHAYTYSCNTYVLCLEVSVHPSLYCILHSALQLQTRLWSRLEYACTRIQSLNASSEFGMNYIILSRQLLGDHICNSMHTFEIALQPS